MTEDELVGAIRKVLSGEAPGVEIPVGDDADLGYKAISVNVSDIAAMEGSPRYALCSIAVPGEVDAPWVIELYGGMREAADDYGMAIVGGDTNRADPSCTFPSP